MRIACFRFTLRTMMIVVALCALVLMLGISVSRAIDPLMGDRGKSVGAVAYIALVAVLAALLALPFIGAVALILRGPPGKSILTRVSIRRWLTAIGLVVLGWSAISYPLDGLRWAHQLRDGSFVTFYHQYRVLPGDHVTPCLEVITAAGESKSYPIARNTYLGLRVDFRTNADQSVVWLIETNSGTKKPRALCSLDRDSGKFITTEGHHPAGVSGTSGFPLWR